MGEYLLFRIYGPLASWGDVAVGEYRPSYAHPSRSAILGLLAAALDIRRHEEERLEELSRSYWVAVRVDAPGELLRDYHTVQSPPQAALKGEWIRTRLDEIAALESYWKANNKTAQASPISQRDYRVDACYSIAVQAASRGPAHTLEELAQALRYPALPLYLGRKSCPPALPLNPRVTQADTLKSAFDQYSNTATELEKLIGHFGYLPFETRSTLTPDLVRYYWEDGIQEAGLAAEMVYPRRDHPRSRRRWQFELRNECYAAETAREKT